MSDYPVKKYKFIYCPLGGYADRGAQWEWTSDIVSQYFSTSKAVAAVVMALLVDRCAYIRICQTLLRHLTSVID